MAFLTNDRSLRELAARALAARHFEVSHPGKDWVVGIRCLDLFPSSRAYDDSIVFEGAHEFHPSTCSVASEGVRYLVTQNSATLARASSDISLAHFSDNCGWLVTGVAGQVPIYVSEHPRGVLITTTLADCVDLLPREPRVDEFALALMAASGPVFPDDRTPIAGVRRIAAGSIMTVRHSSRNTRSYWDPWDFVPTNDQADESSHRVIRALTIGNLKALQQRKRRWAVALSGGVDSSVMAVEAHHLGIDLDAYTLVEANAAGTNAYEHNMGYILSAVAAAGIERHRIEESSDEISIGWIHSADSCVLPTTNILLTRSCTLQSLFRADILLTGTWVDQLFGGWGSYGPWSRSAGIRKILADRRTPYGRKVALRALAREHFRHHRGRVDWAATNLGLPSFSPANVRHEYDEWIERATSPNWSRHPRWDALKHLSLAGAELEWEVYATGGVRTVSPFRSKALVEAALAIDPVALLGRMSKLPFRSAFSASVPPDLLFRADKGLFAVTKTRDIRLEHELEPSVEVMTHGGIPPTGAFLPPADAEHLHLLSHVVSSISTRRRLSRDLPALYT